MERKPLPPPFKRFRKIGGVLDFAHFEGTSGDESSALAAISYVVPDINTTMLRELGHKRLDERTFYGDWYDAGQGTLLRLGTWTTEDGSKLVDPKLESPRSKIISGGTHIPDAGEGGQFAYAFSQPPYPLSADPRVVQYLFSKIRNFILPPRMEHAILDWSHRRLPEASPYFDAGKEWWGVFLFTVHVPALERLTVIVGSATD